MEMYIFMLLSISASTSAISIRSFWDVLENFINVTNVTSGYLPEDAQLNIAQLAKKYSYDLEEHTVITEDGYIINFHRIFPHYTKSENRPVVFLMHGILESSDSWVLQGPENALAYVLADEGFDVWMGNARGNKHALNHTNLDSKAPKFWEFSWEEIALYDLPAMIDYALNVTGKENLQYVGHSQGTTCGYVLLSMKPEYNKKIRMMFSLAPEAWMGNIKSPLVRIFSPAYQTLGYLLENFNTYAPSTEFFNKIFSLLCVFMPVRCDNFLYAITGYSNKINETLLPIIFGHMPTGSSTEQFLHYGQLVLSKRFCRYDYGEDKNMEMYGIRVPPDYDLNNIRTPVVIYYSDNDWLSDPVDVERLKKSLPSVYAYIYVGDFSHLDYLYSSEAVNVIYTKLIKQIRKFEKNRSRKETAGSELEYN